MTETVPMETFCPVFVKVYLCVLIGFPTFVAFNPLSLAHDECVPVMAGDGGVDAPTNMVARNMTLKDGKESMFSCMPSGAQLSPLLLECCVWTGGRVGV